MLAYEIRGGSQKELVEQMHRYLHGWKSGSKMESFKTPVTGMSIQYKKLL